MVVCIVFASTTIQRMEEQSPLFGSVVTPRLLFPNTHEPNPSNKTVPRYDSVS